jgi:hypothetical protein
MRREPVGGRNLVGRRYFIGERAVEVLIGWGPGASVRNVLVRFLDTGERTVRPLRGLRLAARTARSAE